MKLRTTIVKTAQCAIWLLLPCTAFSQNTQLDLKPGFYVREPYQCTGQPNAATMLWDGVGFSGAHSSKCTSNVLSHEGNDFKVSTTCANVGDGSANPSGHADVETFSLTRMSETRFLIVPKNAAKGTYRWCGTAMTK